MANVWVNNKTLSIAFGFIRERARANKKGTAEIKRSIERCPFQIPEYFEDNKEKSFGFLREEIHIGEDVGRETLNILEIILRSKDKEEAWKKYQLFTKGIVPQ